MEKASENFSVIMPLYFGDDENFVIEASNSLKAQTRLPDELVVVIDGAVVFDVEVLLDQCDLPFSVNVIRLSENSGPGVARDVAIANAQHEIIALMDADDISLPNRFEKQLLVLINERVDVVGGWIEEFSIAPGDLKQVRRVPERNAEITRLARFRSPMNHVTVMFRKYLYQKVGGYISMRSFEDHHLFFRMIQHGGQFSNVQEVLVNVRLGNNAIEKRRGLRILPDDYKLLEDMRKSKFISTREFLFGLITRTLLRILPGRVRVVFYRFFLRR